MSQLHADKSASCLGHSGSDGPEFQDSYAKLPERFYSPPSVNPVSAPSLICVNDPLAAELGIDPRWLRSADGLAMLSGSRFPPNANPIALAYAGHQFGNFVPQLGDGRALLIGEIVDVTGRRRDLQLKGSGPTRFSRGGDGRAAIGPVLREYLVSEAMAALGVPTTRSLAAVLTGEPVYRQTALPGAIIARVAASHIRIGTFQFLAYRNDIEGLRMLADYTIERHYPDETQRDQRYLILLRRVVEAQASLVARWMLIGFIHGVMNTDNTTVSGETIDYGPCAFLDAYSPGAVFSSIDQGGRYAFANQPRIAAWNLTRFAETLLPLLHEDTDRAVGLAEQALGAFQSAYETTFHDGLRRKIGLFTPRDGDIQLISDLFDLMARNQIDFTLMFRGLGRDISLPAERRTTRPLFAEAAAIDSWWDRWQDRLRQEPEHHHERASMMEATNPKYIPRNHRIEAAIDAAVREDDFAPFRQLLDVVTKPFAEQPSMSDYARPPEQDERVLQTFCGT